MTTPAARATLGIDFGTTNTVVAWADAGGDVRVARFDAPTGQVTAFRSALGFQLRPTRDGPPERWVEAGPWAVEAYAEEPLDTRFIQSFKTFAASAAFTETTIDNRRYRFEDLLSAFLLRLRGHADGALDDLPPRVVVGRPVTFAGSAPDERLALSRYEAAFGRLGFSDIRYTPEPVGAAFFFARTLQADATVLVADFGGGTSDFSLIRFEKTAEGLRSTALSRSGVAVAGDAFDYRIIDRLVSPELGKGGHYRAFGKSLPIPQRYYTAFARWDQLALLRASRDMRDIRAVARSAEDPERMERLIEILDDNHGYALYRAVSDLKIALSSRDEAVFDFSAGSVRIRRPVSRTDFEDWITPDLAAIEAAVERAMTEASIAPAAVDRVFLTGGTSFVPAVRDLFVRRFGRERIESGGEFESIASGLALIGLEPDLEAWSDRFDG